MSASASSRFFRSSFPREAFAVSCSISSGDQGDRFSSPWTAARSASASVILSASVFRSWSRWATSKRRSCVASNFFVISSSSFSALTRGWSTYASLAAAAAFPRSEGSSFISRTKNPVYASDAGIPHSTRRKESISSWSSVTSENFFVAASKRSSCRAPPSSRSSRYGLPSPESRPTPTRVGPAPFIRRLTSSGAGHTDAVSAARRDAALDTTATYPDLSESCPSAGRSLTFWNSSSVSCTLAPSARALLGCSALFGGLEARRLALQLAEIEEARALDPAAAHDFDAVDPRRIEREDALDPHAIAHLADGERGAHVSALFPDDHTLEDLDALLVPFADLRVHPHGVAHAELGDLTPDFRLHVALLHQLDRSRTHLRILV